MDGASGEKSKLWGMSWWAWAALLVSGSLWYLLWASGAGAMGGGVWDAMHDAVDGSAMQRLLWRVRRVAEWHDSMSVGWILIGVGCLHFSSVRGWAWRAALFTLWFGVGAVAADRLMWSMVWTRIEPGSWLGLLATTFLQRAPSLWVGLVVFPAVSVRVTWSFWWLASVAWNVMPSNVFGAVSGWDDWIDAAGLFAVIASMVIWAVRLRRSIVAVGSCRKCRYDLSGTAVDAPCPECGEEGTRVV